MNKTWWKESVVYQIYPRSFCDSNGDGIGDLKGIQSKLDYLKELGINVIWMSPVYKSPNDDNGYDISDYQDIMTEFGTMEDFDELLAAAHERGIRIVMDLVVNHTSDEHPWFIESRSSKENPKRDYYIWRDAVDGHEPNNWGSAFSGSAWEWDEKTQMYYLHCFSKKQPDLNWENPKVRDDVFAMMDWWCRKGIDGFRMDVISMISKKDGLPDVPTDGGLYGNCMYGTCNGPHVHEYLQEMNQRVLSKYDLMTVGECAGVTIEEAKKYANAEGTELNMVFQFEHTSLDSGTMDKWCKKPIPLQELKANLSKWENELEGKAWNSLYFCNHDQPRIVSRLGDDSPLSAKCIATVLHMMQGTPYVYQGEELGMTNCPSGTMVLSLGACGGSGDSGSSDSGSSSGTTLRLVNGKIEVDEQLKKLASMYEEETGVKVEIESMGGGVDIQGTLKGYYQGGNMPDIFVNGSIPDFENWEGMLVDMSDQEWVSDTDQAYVDEEYGTIGFPYTVEAVGLSYNKNILEQAGIDPASITGPDSMRQAFETLDAKKDELGLTAVVGYCAEVASLYWSTGNHLFANYLDAGLDRDDTTYIDMLNDGGQIDTDRMTKFAEMVELFQEYSDPSLLVSGTYDQQILNFASGKYAFVTQGSWIGATMTSTDAEAYEAAGNFEVGMIPYAFEEGIDTILTNSPSWWSIYSESENVDAALDFLQWCSESTAQQVLVEEAGFISPFKSCEYVASDPFAQTITDYQEAEKTSAWHWLYMIEGLAQNYTGQVFGDFAAGNLDVDGFVSTMQQVLQSAYAG